MSKTIEILELVKWLDDNLIPANVGMSEMMLRDWLKSKMWEPKVGEGCEFSDCPDFPDDKTVIGYFVRKTDTEVWLSRLKSMPSMGQLPYRYIRPIKGGGE
jgi:hypothetical protein